MQLRSERGGMSLGGAIALVVVLGVVSAVPLMLMGRSQKEQLETGAGVIASANEAQAQLQLQNALRAAQVYFAETGSFQGFTPAVASAYDPSVRYNASSKAVAGEVSVRGVSAFGVVLVTADASGRPLCAAADHDTISYGRADALAVDGCTGGW